MLKVTNGYQTGFLGKDKIYIGRKNSKLKLSGSIFCNPFPLYDFDSREECMARYKEYLKDELIYNPEGKIAKELINLSIKEMAFTEYHLVCYCKPKDCHGDLLKEVVQMYLEAPSGDAFLKALCQW